MRIQGLFSIFSGSHTRQRAESAQAGLLSQENINASPRIGKIKTFFNRVVRWLKTHLSCRKKQARSDLVRSVLGDTTTAGTETTVRHGPTAPVLKGRHASASARSQLGTSWSVMGHAVANNSDSRHPLPEWRQALSAQDEILASGSDTADFAVDTERSDRVDDQEPLDQPGHGLQEVSRATTPQRPDAPPAANRLPTERQQKQSCFIRNTDQVFTKFLVCHKSLDPDIERERDFFNVRLEHEFLEVAKEVATEILGTNNKQCRVSTQGMVANRVFYRITHKEKHVVEYYDEGKKVLRRAVNSHNAYCHSHGDAGYDQALLDNVTLPWDQKKQEQLVIDDLKKKFKNQYRDFLCDDQFERNRSKLRNPFTTSKKTSPRPKEP